MNDAAPIAPVTLGELAYMLLALALGCFAGVASNTNNVPYHGGYDSRRELKAALLGGMVGMLLAILVLWKTNIKQLGYAAAIGGGLFCDEIVALVPGYLKGAADWLAEKIGFKKAGPIEPPAPPAEPDADPKP